MTDADTLTINSAGTTPTFARREFTTEIGREYILTATAVSNPSYVSVGTEVGGNDLLPGTILLVNLIGSTTAWTDTFGGGTVVTSSGDTIVITGNGTATGVRKSFTTVAGQHYRIKWTTSGNTCATAFGTTSGGEQYKGLGTAHDPLGANEFIFLASATTVFLQFQRTPTGTACTVGSLALEQID